jgi:ATP-dependent Clp protease ATP-binding subunit ClpC
MFERYTEKARRVIFFARYEASQLGSPFIETEHLLLAILREDKTLMAMFVPREATETVRQQIESKKAREKWISTSVDLPLSQESKRVLVCGAEEADRLNKKTYWYRAPSAGFAARGGWFRG